MAKPPFLSETAIYISGLWFVTTEFSVAAIGADTVVVLNVDGWKYQLNVGNTHIAPVVHEEWLTSNAAKKVHDQIAFRNYHDVYLCLVVWNHNAVVVEIVSQEAMARIRCTGCKRVAISV